MSESQKLEKLEHSIVKYSDWPKPGMFFWDVFSWLKDPSLFGDLIDLMVNGIKLRHEDTQIDAIVGLETRGFLFGPVIALRIGSSFVPIGKKGKLPGDKFSVSYSLEYGEDVMEIQKDAVNPGDKVIIIDDVLATGGTLYAACKLVKSIGADILECLVAVELDGLHGRKKFDAPCVTVLHSDDYYPPI